MFWLRQLFRVREHLQIGPTESEGCMGIIDHLEELRRTIICMVCTLLVSMVLCFGFFRFLLRAHFRLFFCCFVMYRASASSPFSFGCRWSAFA